MTPIHDNPCPESVAHAKQIGWSFVAATILLTLAGFFAHASGPSGSLRPTIVKSEIAADTAVIDTLLVTRGPRR